MTSRLRTLPVTISIVSVFLPQMTQAQNSFRVRPYLQNPPAKAMSIIQLSDIFCPGNLKLNWPFTTFTANMFGPW